MCGQSRQCTYDAPSLICCMPCFIFYAIFYIYLCHFYVFISISIHVASLFIYAAPTFPFFVVLSSLFYVVLTQIYVASRFVSRSTFSITLYSEKLSLPAVACGHTHPTGSEITRHNNSL